MKAFNKWSEQNSYDRTETQKAWRAALEWALSIDDGFCNCGSMNVDEHTSTYEQIEEELNGL